MAGTPDITPAQVFHGIEADPALGGAAFYQAPNEFGGGTRVRTLLVDEAGWMTTIGLDADRYYTVMSSRNYGLHPSDAPRDDFGIFLPELAQPAGSQWARAIDMHRSNHGYDPIYPDPVVSRRELSDMVIARMVGMRVVDWVIAIHMEDLWKSGEPESAAGGRRIFRSTGVTLGEITFDSLAAFSSVRRYPRDAVASLRKFKLI